ncbi:MAG TPA: decaprenyl-phosphate phosphoribosyltransferase [Myxococcales bacterium]|nr:decaprenyl-phosphate phosphoribosyltransferase [Deltaproteobacteria bacterium]MBU51318.1 decaprenyl-phosphate phosphoribosyltransferase [Deltaproteobacteria bacterium]HAA57971.1 decaprenyl-phosphate phosphoribosyltransferase [Myxococcales bacterium]|tara:strand:+ start:10825 stop:11736 length:912 start_codon:yes stop_codon:yes gene_type:complete
MLIALIRTMRPHQWAKNTLIFGPLLFGQKLLDVSAVTRSSLGFVLFCFLASSIYILNDVVDVEKDKLHPKKKHRPIPSGKLPLSFARKIWPFFAIGAVVGGFFLSPYFALICLCYLVMNIGYSFRLKRVPYLDIMIIASGFLLRALAGILILDVAISRWILPCTFLLALYLALGKRRHELSAHGERATKQRDVLAYYDIEKTDLFLGIIASLTVLAYCGYTLDPETLRKFKTPFLIYTIPFIVFAILRFLQLIQRGVKTESPTQELLRDIPSLLNVVLWVVAVIYIIYFQPGHELLKASGLGG